MNKMGKITLTENHRRSLSSSLKVAEKSIDELKKELICQDDQVMNKIKRSLTQDEITECIAVIQKIKLYISFLKEKYGLEPSVTDITRIINAKKSTIWEILVNTTSAKLKGYGKFPAKYAEEFDSDLNELIELINKL